MKDIAIAISVGSPNSKWVDVQETFESIRNSIGECDWKIFLYIGEKISADVNRSLLSYVAKYKNNFQIIGQGDCYWSEFINLAIDASRDYKYFIKSHDDIVLVTKNLYTRICEFYESNKTEFGWLSFTDIGWKNGDFSPSTRPGFHKDFIFNDAWETGKIFQFRKFPANWVRSGYIQHLVITYVNLMLKKSIFLFFLSVIQSINNG
jgi:hypothetical protein